MASDTAGDRPNLEAALLSEHWDSVLTYAELCTITSEEATTLASQAFTRTLREAPPWSAPHFAWLPRLLIGVRNTAADWQAEGHAHLLAPGLQRWLRTDEADSPSTALHGFQDMPEPDKSLLWHAEIEARPTAESAAALGITADRAAEEIVRTRELFRESCLRLRLHSLVDDASLECRGYAKLLDVATRDPDPTYPPDLRLHLARCSDCAITADDYALHGQHLAHTLADGVLGWAGVAYLVRRHAAAPAAPGTPAPPPTPHAARRRVGLTAAALAVPALVIAAILAPSSNAPTSNAGAPAPIPTAFPTIPDGATPSASPSRSATAAGPGHVTDDATRLTAAPSQAATKSKAPHASASPSHTHVNAPANCTAHYRVVNEWNDGFEASVELTSRTALNGWRVEWNYPDGQHLTQVWNGTLGQSGAHVTITEASYNASIPSGQTLSFGFLGTWSGSNGAPSSLTLNGAACAT